MEEPSDLDRKCRSDAGAPPGRSTSTTRSLSGKVVPETRPLELQIDGGVNDLDSEVPRPRGQVCPHQTPLVVVLHSKRSILEEEKRTTGRWPSVRPWGEGAKPGTRVHSSLTGILAQLLTVPLLTVAAREFLEPPRAPHPKRGGEIWYPPLPQVGVP